MKILHIIDALTMGGAENLLIGLAGEQVKRGYDVTVAPLVCPSSTPVREKMEASGVKVKPFKSTGSVYYPFFVFRIAKEIRKYDIVHVHLFPALYWAGLANIVTCKRTPFIYTEHSTKNKRRSNKILHATDRFIYQNCYKTIVACSDKALETYQEAYPTITHVCAINNGVDTQIYREALPYTKQELWGIDENCFAVTMVARFMTMKRQDTVVEAISKLPDRIHAVFVGGEETDEGLIRVKRIAEEKGIINRIHFMYLRKDVPRILKSSDVVIMASDYEGLSLSSIEGMAAGKPFVATDVDGLREVVGGAGVLFENKDSEALSHIINKLSTETEYYKGVAQRCSNRAEHYDIKYMVDGYLKVYEKESC